MDFEYHVLVHALRRVAQMIRRGETRDHWGQVDGDHEVHLQTDGRRLTASLHDANAHEHGDTLICTFLDLRQDDGVVVGHNVKIDLALVPDILDVVAGLLGNEKATDEWQGVGDWDRWRRMSGWDVNVFVGSDGNILAGVYKVENGNTNAFKFAPLVRVDWS